ncbi:MAG: VCBS repeat-containing protein [Deltaproteobacteria bacterium]|nr:VCBS repeat-containing protein [Deltaproteobacteria bacterium]MBW2695490.1 VCBS repeat-containing protein [Deltaproteobacteria bacterium]
MSRRQIRLLLLLIWVVMVIAWSAAAPRPVHADDLFALTQITSLGRNVAAELADVDGDGRSDLFVVVLTGIPPKEEREIRVYLQRDNKTFPARSDYTRSLPRWSAVYDVADVRADSPGEELIVLRPDGVSIISLAGPDAPIWELRVPGPTTAGIAADERGFEPFKLVYDDFAEEPWILVPQLGQLSALSPTGEVRAQLAVPRRANYLILPPSGLISLETDFQIFVDVPKLMVGDIDGDGRADIASATRHEIKVFLRKQDGSFAFEPDRKLALEMVTPRDHIRGTGGVASEAKDIDGDGKLDLLISHVMGGFTDATTTIHVYMNHDGAWHLEKPDQSIISKGSLSSNALFDIVGNGKMELLQLEFRFGLLEVIEIMLSREIDIDVSLYRFQGEKGFEEKPWVKKKLELPFSFDTLRLKGFIPNARQDLNGDGYQDFVMSGGGKKIEVFIGGPKGPFHARPSKQTMPTAGVIHFDDWTGDGLMDFVIFDPHNFDVPVQLGRNLGQLPGTSAALRAAP